MRLTVSEAAKLTGVSVRALHYYDEIGLLPPGETSGAGYRYYGEPELSRLQDILFYKELGVPLKEIRSLLTLPGYSRKKALKKQKKLLELREKQLKALVQAAESALKGEKEPAFHAFRSPQFEKAKETALQELRNKFAKTN